MTSTILLTVPQIEVLKHFINLDSDTGETLDTLYDAAMKARAELLKDTPREPGEMRARWLQRITEGATVDLPAEALTPADMRVIVNEAWLSFQAAILGIRRQRSDEEAIHAFEQAKIAERRYQTVQLLMRPVCEAHGELPAMGD